MAQLIDLKDKKIISQLDLNSRQTNKQIAKKVGLSEQVTGNRIKRLIDLKIIDYFYVRINPSLLGFMHLKIYLRLHNLTKQKEGELIKELILAKGIFWLASLRGKYDFSQKYEGLLGKWGNYILLRNVVFLEKVQMYNKKYLIPKSETVVFTYSEGKEQSLEIDKLDSELLKI